MYNISTIDTNLLDYIKLVTKFNIARCDLDNSHYYLYFTCLELYSDKGSSLIKKYLIKSFDKNLNNSYEEFDECLKLQKEIDFTKFNIEKFKAVIAIYIEQDLLIYEN